TINLDYRSLCHHFECAVYLYKTPCIADIRKDFMSTLSSCIRVDEEQMKNEPLTRRIMGPMLRIIAPLL
ncbi:MAG: cardiolipin synthase, partial [Clostridia bacterium]|nr:cardiolipin synthase [Clostridia bacterium]